MRNRFTLVLLTCPLLLAACGQKEETAEGTTASAAVSETADTAEDTETATTTEETTAPDEGTVIAVTGNTTETGESTKEEGSRSLVVYFSLAGEQLDVGVIEKGNTAIVGDLIAEKTGSDTFEIVPVNSYPTDLQSLFDVASEEQDEDARPDYVGDVENWADYDTVFVGYPLWYNDLPMIVYHFLEDHDFTGKTIYPFDTCGSEGLLDTVDTIRSICTGAKVKDGLSVRGVTVQNDPDSAEEAVDSWLSENGLLQQEP